MKIGMKLSKETITNGPGVHEDEKDKSILTAS